MKADYFEKNGRKSTILTVFWILLISWQTFGQTQIKPQPLLPNQTIERKMTDAETHRYQIELKANEFFQVEIEQKSINVTLRLYDSKGNELITSENSKASITINGTPLLSYITTTDSAYFLDVTAPISIDVLNDVYKLSRKASRAATDDEKKEIADLLSKKGSDSSTKNLVKQAIVQYQNALSLYESISNDDNSIVGKLVCNRTLGSIYFELKDNITATKYLEKTLDLLPKFKQIFPNADLKVAQTILFNDLGKAYFAEGMEEIALTYLNQIDFEDLNYWKDKKEKYILKEALDTLFSLYVSLGDIEDYDKSIKIFNRMINYFNSDENFPPSIYKDFYMSYLYSSLAKAYTEAGYYLNAVNSNKIGLEINLTIQKKLESVKDDEAKRLKEIAINSESNFRNNIGIDFLRSGNFDEAEKYIQDALNIAIKQNDSIQIVKWKANLAGVYARQKKFEIALKGFDETLPELKKLRDEYAEKFKKSKDISDRLEERNLATFVGIDLYYYGTILREKGKLQEAIRYHKDSIQTLNQSRFRKFEARARVEIGLDYLALNKPELAKEEFTKAFQLSKSIKAKDEQIVALDGLMRTWQNRGNNLAIFYGKQSVNLLQTTRAELKELGENFASEFVKDNENTYRKLAEILVVAGRFFEAQQILTMLKEAEYFGYVRRDPDEIKNLSARADLFNPREQAALAKYEQLAGKVTEYGTQLAKLEEVKNAQGAEFKQQAEYKELKLKVDDANRAFRLFLDKGLVVEFSQKIVKEIKEDRELQEKLRQWGNGTVALYTITGEDRYRVILTTPRTQIDRKYEIKVKDLNEKIYEFREELQNPLGDPRKLGKELYDILIKPIEKDLDAAEAKTLLWSLDGALRYIPIPALSPDEVHYLAENYQNVVITSSTRDNLTEEVNPNWQILGAGVTKPSKLIEPNGTAEITFCALFCVENELLSIVRNEDTKTEEKGVLKGKRMIDEGFTLTSLEEGMSQRIGNKPKYNVIHLATHFSLGNDNAKSFLLLGNNRALTLEEISDNTVLNFGDLELVTLSACNTGFGTATENKVLSKEQERIILGQNNGAEVDSLATYIELRGAKSVMATLWSVADESTSLLMNEFYRLKKDNPQMTKAEAMQKAQNSMIQGNLKPSGKQTGCGARICSLDKKQAEYKSDANKSFAHPYYWSPFILIGNWR